MFHQRVRQIVQRVRVLLPGRSGRIVFVCATRLEPEEFWRASPTGPALQQMMQASDRVDCQVAFRNSLGLPAVYNAALSAARREDILVFLHDDLWFPAKTIATMEAALRQGLSQFDVLGVAGNRRHWPDQSAWIYTEDIDGKRVTHLDYLSGAILMGASYESAVLSDYGPAPAACALLDGVLLAARAGRLRSAGVRFDEQFDFHHYDLDFCRTARQARLRLGTWPLLLAHRSIGDFAGPAFDASRVKFRAKWAAADAGGGKALAT